MNRPSDPLTPFGISPIAAQGAGSGANTPWDDRNTDVQFPATPMEDPAAAPIDLGPSLGQAAPAPSSQPPLLPGDGGVVAKVTYALPDVSTGPSLRLGAELVGPEPFWRRHLYLLIAVTFTIAYGWTLLSYWAPAPGRPGIDQNGYLVGGKNIALHGTVGFKPHDEYQFIGAMWIRTDGEDHAPSFSRPRVLREMLTVHTKDGWYYPKYPFGVSLLDAIAIWIGGAHHGREAAFLVSPICATLAVFGMFLLARPLVGPFYALLAMIVLATTHTTLEHGLDPNSHAPDLCFVVWGMFLLMRWWQTGRWWRGVLAGLLLGYAVTIRYTEAMLLLPLYPLDQVLRDVAALKEGSGYQHDHPKWFAFWHGAINVARLLPIGPIGLAVLFGMKWRRWRSYLLAPLPIIAWALPVALLVGYNWLSVGHVTTYDLTNESEGFSTEEFLRKWDFTVHELYLYGLFVFLPLGVAGLAYMFRRSARVALILTMWFLPGTLLYNSYYWGMGIRGIWYLRFFLTMFPPLILAGMWLLRTASVGGALREAAAGVGGIVAKRRWRGSIAGPVGAGILTASAAAVGLMISLPDLERQHRGNLNLAYSAQWIRAKVKTPSVNDRPVTPIAFADAGMCPQLLQYIQFMSDCDWYGTDGFDVRFAGGFGMLGVMQAGQDKDAPVVLQQARVKHMTEFFKGRGLKDLIKAQHELLDGAMREGRPVYAILTSQQESEFKRRFITGSYDLVKLDHWAEPCNIHFPDESIDMKNGRPKEHVTPLGPAMHAQLPWMWWAPQELTMYEIRPKAVEAAPATQPATQPSNPPASAPAVAVQGG